MQQEIINKNSDKFSMFFIAVVCPPELDEQIKKYKQWIQLNFGCRNALKSPSHITLISPFWWKKEESYKLAYWLKSFTFPEDLEVKISGVDTFGKRVLFIKVLSNERLSALHRSIQKHFSTQSGMLFEKENLPFHPHITLATRDIKPGDLEKAKYYFEKKSIEMKFKSDTISLLELIGGKWEIR